MQRPAHNSAGRTLWTRGPHGKHLRFRGRGHQGQATEARRLQGQGHADRERRQQVRIHAAVQGARGAVREAARTRPRSPRLSLQSVRRAGARIGSRDRAVLRAQLRRQVPSVRQDRRQRQQCRAALPVPEEGETGPPWLGGDQVELHQVPRRPQGQRRRTLCAERRAAGDRRRHREAAVMRPALRLALLAVVSLALAPAHAADPNKTLRVAFNAAETGFDPQAGGDAYSNYVNRVIFEALYGYDYLARPYRIVPNTAAALPEISPDGKTWIIKLKHGIYFADDPVFKGRKRELTADDYIYSWKRVLDPKMRSISELIFDERVVGAETAVSAAKEAGKFDYDAPIEGLQAIDRYTIRIKLKHPSYDLLSDLTTAATSAVAREVIAAYGDASGWAMANPVGTGPYRLKEWRRGQKIALEANPGYRDIFFPDSRDPADRELIASMHGKKLPQIGRIEISIIEESNPRLLSFENRELDFVAVPVDLIRNVLDPDDKLKARFKQQGVTMWRAIQPAITYTYFNMEDPVVGGYSNDKIALRRAVGMAFNTEDEIRIVRQGQGEPATQPISPNVTGYDPKFNGHVHFDPAGA